MRLGAVVLAGALALPSVTKGGELEVCQMRVEYDATARLFHAIYETEELCGDEPPRWVAIDFDVEHVVLETMNHPQGRRADCSDPAACNAGFYMRPVNFPAWVPSTIGRTYVIQARSVDNGGRANVEFSFGRDGGLTVTSPAP
jgi:hypothetical protein